MSDDAFDKQEDDPELAWLEQLLGGYAHAAPLRPLRPLPSRRGRWPVIMGLVAAAAVALLMVWPEREPPSIVRKPAQVDACAGGPGFAFATEGGVARCADGESTAGVLPIGQWLETSTEVSARLEIADIGSLTVHGGSRVRLIGTGADEHRLELARGRVSAMVSAPPRLFVIDTPGASAVDLGCAYELSVDDEGRTHLSVTAGAVSLEGHGLVAYVAAGSEVVAVPGRGPGTPTAVGAGAPLRDAVARFDAGDATALDELLALAAARDAVTLWNLLDRTAGDARSSVARRLESLHPSSLPDDVLDAPTAVHGPACQSAEPPWIDAP